MQHETGFGFVRLLRGVFPPACSVGGCEVDRVGGGQTARAVIALFPVGDIHALDAHDRAGARRMDKLAVAQVNAHMGEPVAPCIEEHQRSEEHTSELQSLMRISYAVFCLKKKKKKENAA